MSHKITKLSDTRYKVETGRLTLYVKCVELPTQDDYIMNTTYKAGVYKVDDGEDVKTVQADSVEDAIQAYMYSMSPQKVITVKNSNVIKVPSGGLYIPGFANNPTTQSPVKGQPMPASSAPDPMNAFDPAGSP